MVGGAHLFVEELLNVAEDLGVEALVLSLILAPLATELPEKVNSFFWVREGKDSLALGNITGAMVFQSTIPVGIGLLFTDWDLSGNAAVSVALGLAGGVIAYWALRLRDRFELPAVLAWIALYAAFIVVVAGVGATGSGQPRSRASGCGCSPSSASIVPSPVMPSSSPVPVPGTIVPVLVTPVGAHQAGVLEDEAPRLAGERPA